MSFLSTSKLAVLSCILVLSVCPFGFTQAQDLFKAKDLSTVKVDQLPESDLLKLLQQLKQASLSMSQAEQLAAARGMPQGEIMKLRDRLNALEKNGPETASQNSSPASKEVNESAYVAVAKPNLTPAVFGAQLFTTASLAFEPNLRIATPAHYQLGPDDELQLNIFGVQEASFRLPIVAEGTITIPNVGIITVAGLNLEDATRVIRQKMASTVYRTLATAASNMTLTLGKIRSIRVTVVGAASKPGNYTVSSFTTLFNALYLCGGPNEIGSYRQIELIRNNKVFVQADLYDFLIKGDTRQNILLKEGDVINIPVYQKRTVIQGEIKRPGYFEMLDKETANDLIRYAGGFTEKAYTATVKISQLTEKERRIRDLEKQQFLQYIPQAGDSITIGTILERYENKVTLHGAVFRPGDFELEKGLTISKLIGKADGLKEDAYTSRGLLIRQKADLSQESIAFSLSDIMNNPTRDIALQKNDVVQIASVYDLKDNATVTINGEVRKPGVIPFKDNYSLKDLVFEAGGFTDAASAYRIEISRRVNATKEGPFLNGKLAEVITINSDRDLGLDEAPVGLQPFDMVTVRRDPGYFEQQQVTVSGEVLFPGNYTIQNKGERISDVLKRAGGFTPSAYPEAVSLIRKNKDPKIQKEEKAKIFTENLKDSVNMHVMQELMGADVKIALNLRKILADPSSLDNLLLEPGDVLEVPKNDGLVKISGEVYSPTKVAFAAGESLNHYLSRAGGITDNAQKGRTYVIYANGHIAKTQRYLFGLVKSYPKLQPGADIVVPAKTIKTKMSTSEMISMAGVMVSMAGVTIAIINTLR